MQNAGRENFGDEFGIFLENSSLLYLDKFLLNFLFDFAVKE